MGKAITYFTILTFYLLTFALFGFIPTSGPDGSPFLTLLLNPNSFFEDGLWLKVSLFLSASIIASLLVTSVTRQNITDLLVSIAMTTALITYAHDMIMIYNHIAAANQYLAWFIVLPFMFLSVFTIIEWFRGKD